MRRPPQALHPLILPMGFNGRRILRMVCVPRGVLVDLLSPGLPLRGESLPPRHPVGFRHWKVTIIARSVIEGVRPQQIAAGDTGARLKIAVGKRTS